MGQEGEVEHTVNLGKSIAQFQGDGEVASVAQLVVAQYRSTPKFRQNFLKCVLSFWGLEGLIKAGIMGVYSARTRNF